MRLLRFLPPPKHGMLLHLWIIWESYWGPSSGKVPVELLPRKKTPVWFWPRPACHYLVLRLSLEDFRAAVMYPLCPHTHLNIQWHTAQQDIFPLYSTIFWCPLSFKQHACLLNTQTHKITAVLSPKWNSSATKLQTWLNFIRESVWNQGVSVSMTTVFP